MAKKRFKNSEICHMSDSTSRTKNDDSESEIDLVKVNAIYLNHFFLEKDNSDKLTDKKSIDDGI